MPSHLLSDVRRLLGVSDDTLRRWVDSGFVESVKDEQGRLRIDGGSLAARLVEQQRAGEPLEDGAAVRSTRNHFQGVVTAITSDTVMSQVELVCGPARVVSLISTEAVRELGLEVGSVAAATVKATDVSIVLPQTR